jgi:predicted transcriptional regulator
MAKTVTDACLERQAWQLAYIEEAVRQAEAGKFATEGEVAATFQRLLASKNRKARS